VSSNGTLFKVLPAVVVFAAGGKLVPLAGKHSLGCWLVRIACTACFVALRTQLQALPLVTGREGDEQNDGNASVSAWCFAVL